MTICGASATTVCVYDSGHEGLCSYNAYAHKLEEEARQATFKVERLTTALRHIQNVAEAAAQGRESVSHWWYGEEVYRVLDSDKAN